MMKRTIAAAVVAISLGTFSQAQEIALGIAPEENLDVLGFTIGMSLDEALANVSSRYPNARPNISERRHRESKVEFTNAVVIRSETNGQREELILFFTGHYSGNNLWSVSRSVTYPRDNQADLYQTRDGILAKYGLPTLSNGATRLQYAFNPERVLLGTEAEVQAVVDEEGYDYGALLRNSGSSTQPYLDMTNCIAAIQSVQSLQRFNAAEAQGEPPTGCTAALDIELGSQGSGLLRTFNVKLADYQFVLDSAKIDMAGDAGERIVPEATAASPDL